MKRQRFEDVHRAALRWPQTAFSYVGIDNEEGAAEAYSGEVRFCFLPFHTKPTLTLLASTANVGAGAVRQGLLRLQGRTACEAAITEPVQTIPPVS